MKLFLLSLDEPLECRATTEPNVRYGQVCLMYVVTESIKELQGNGGK